MSEQSDQIRANIRALTTLASRDLAVIFREVGDAVRTREALRDILPGLIDAYGSAAGTVAADWYDQQRERQGIKKRFEAAPAEIRGDGGADELARWGVSPLFDAKPDPAAARTLIEGGLQRRIANVARETVMESTYADPSAQGWERVSQGGCNGGFCDMLAGRGTVYSEASADFASHDHCQCFASPAFLGEPRPVKPYTPSLTDVSEVDKARVRAYLRTH